jgi:hypothetical protein
MTTTVETDLTKKLETSSLQSSSTGKEAADAIKAQANEAFKSINILFLFQ